MKKLKKIPQFNTEAAERKFWELHDSVDYVDWSEAKRVKFTNLTPSTQTISLRLPEWLLNAIKIESNKRDIPYQSYMKMILSEKFCK